VEKPVTLTGERAGELRRQIIAEFRSAFGELRCVGSARLVRQGVSMGHLHLMTLIERHGEMSMSRLAELLDVSLSNATGIVDRMEERGYVVRVRVPDDRRVVHVQLSEGGRLLLQDAEIFREDLMRQILGRLDDRQLQGVARTLDDLRSAIVEVLAAHPELFEHDAIRGHSHSPELPPTIDTPAS
jgi:DNA-binding MarR family transcriptional regulator